MGAVGYDQDARVLRLRFSTGRVYDYFGVEPYVYRELLAAPSLGAYFNRRIRGRYQYHESGRKTLVTRAGR